MYTAQEIMASMTPLLVDSMLLVRVLAFYPPRKTRWIVLVKVLAFPVLIKAGRLGAEIAFFVVSDKSQEDVVSPWFRHPYSVGDWTLQVLDNRHVHPQVLFFFSSLMRP